MARRYLLDPLPPPGRHRLPPDLAHHLVRVARARAGDPVVLFDGRGQRCLGHIESARGRNVEVALEAAEPDHREPAVRLHLAFALPKGQRAEWLFEHATEVGAAVLRPVLCARSDRRPAERADRWLRIVRAAAAQCDRSHLPEVRDPQPLDDLLTATDLPAERYAAAAGAPPLGAATTPESLVLVGPPGGFTDHELTQLTAAHFAPRGLGPLTLRTETAALVATARLLS